MSGLRTLRSGTRARSCIVSALAAESAPVLAVALFACEAVVIPSIAKLATAWCQPTIGLFLEDEERGISGGAR